MFYRNTLITHSFNKNVTNNHINNHFKLDNIVNKLVLDNYLTVTYQLLSKDNAFFEYTLDIENTLKKWKD